MSDNAWCPYCDSLRSRMKDGRLLKTCGSERCVNIAYAASFVPWPTVTGEINFKNGFARHNLTFAPDPAPWTGRVRGIAG